MDLRPLASASLALLAACVPADPPREAARSEAAIAAAEKEVAGVLQVAGEGKYAVPTGLGWLDMNAIQAALALPDCRPKDSPSPCLPPLPPAGAAATPSRAARKARPRSTI